MHYMLMCCFEENAWKTLPEAERSAIMQEYGAIVQGLIKNGQLRGGGQLHPTSAATTIRMKNGKTVLTDGPFAETKEQLGGYHLSSARIWTKRSPLPCVSQHYPPEAQWKCGHSP